MRPRYEANMGNPVCRRTIDAFNYLNEFVSQHPNRASRIVLKPTVETSASDAKFTLSWQREVYRGMFEAGKKFLEKEVFVETPAKFSYDVVKVPGILAFLGNLANFDTLVRVHTEIKATASINKADCKRCSIRTTCPLIN